MTLPRFTLSWDSFQQNICSGLGSLQQNEEFVDMTIAADGHFVKVHQLVLSLASPYIKDLIKSAQCQNPVIFLNIRKRCCIVVHKKISEIILRRNVMPMSHTFWAWPKSFPPRYPISPACHARFLFKSQGCRTTHFCKTLDFLDQPVQKFIGRIGRQFFGNWKVSFSSLCLILEYIYTGEVVVNKENLEELIEAARALHIKGLKDMNYHATSETPRTTFLCNSQNTERFSTQKNKQNHHEESHPIDHDDHQTMSSQSDLEMKTTEETASTDTQSIVPRTPEIQYSVSNQGNLQMVLNRYVYFLRYTGKSNHRTWRCTDYVKNKCPASVTTKDNVVIKRIHAHIHPFHDKKIAKKVRAAAIFSLITDAQKERENLKKNSQDQR